MIFNEIYSAYYNAVAKIIAQIISGETDEKELNQIVCDYAFGESMLTVLPSLKNEKWQLVRADMTTPIKHKPTMPLTLIQKQWLKAISLDPRIKLFGINFDNLNDVEPLFTQDDYVIYDKYGDGDPFEDEGYIERFKIILSALKEKQPIKIKTVNRKGNIISMTVMPRRLEYSEKDDKFRLISSGCRYGGTVNLARIVSCEKCYGGSFTPKNPTATVKKSVTLRIRDDRNALERCLLHFAHFEKRAERVDNKHYLVHIKYDKYDETEMVIRILSFGPLVEVIEPNDFRNLIIERLQRQKSCELK
ncbi:MAG: WYL domain-containing protein [Oscillospiraceae bacterium]|nr:WYL domain-containing protein [Oscillospiraceae bacterium]